MKKLLLLGCALLATPALAKITISDYTFNPKLGISPYTSILGLEVQKSHWSVGFGLTVAQSLSVKYYTKQNADSVYYGVFIKTRKTDHDDVVYGVATDNYKSKEIGIGAGYTWVWPSGLNTSAGLSISDLQETFSNPNISFIFEESPDYGFDLTIGRKFNFAK